MKTKSKEKNEKADKTKQKESKSKSKKEKQKGKEKEKEKTIEEENENENKIPIPQPKNIERYIYISTYLDVELMSNLKLIFEEINQKAFNFASPREIYTYNLTQEEQNNNSLDYISGFQVTDGNLRLSIIEGITGKGMQRVKEILPKIKMNDNRIKILTNAEILFDTRIYSKFNLSLKIIKLRNNLNKYLQTYTIYEKAHRSREIYDCFQNIASILRVETFEEVSWYKLFPSVEGLLLLERKHADMLTHQDITGLYKEIKKVKKINLNNLMSEKTNSYNTITNNNNSSETEIKNNNNNSNNNIKNELKLKKIHLSKSQGNIYICPMTNKYRLEEKKKAEEYFLSYQEKLKNIHKLILKPKTNSKNELYEKFLKKKKNKRLGISKSQMWENNFEYIEKLKREIPPVKRFCQPCKPGEEIIETPKQILFCPTKKNYFDSLVKNMREKYIKDKKHFYSYSDYSIYLSFPMYDTSRNEEYIKYIENKKKWRNKKDFERFKQPEREKIYFPRINNIL